jgi:hypothetical protein
MVERVNTEVDIRNPHVEHEPRDVGVRTILGIALGMIIAGIVIQVGVGLLFQGLATTISEQRQAVSPLAAKRSALPPLPRLEQVHRLANEPQISQVPATPSSNFRWVDRSAGVVEIPIEEAMKLVVEQAAARKDGPETDKKPHHGPVLESASGRFVFPGEH